MEKMHYMGKSIEFDREKCIRCTKCIIKCKNCSINYLELKGEGKLPKEKFLDAIENKKCIKCGQCTLVCPVDAIREQSSIEEVKKELLNTNKITIVQCAPSVRTSIGELFNLEHSILMEKKLNTAFRKLGFKKVFDVNFGADITTMAEGEELIERLNDKNAVLPMFTACCPAWVEYVKNYRSDLIPNLTTARSPHIHSGLAYKTWWAEKNNINPADITVVSIMPCTAKKEEAELESTKNNGLKAVDYVLTVRELSKLIKESSIDFENLEDSEADSLGEYSGAGAIYGASGGVMESALRSAYYLINGKVIDNLDIEDVRTDSSGCRTSVINLGKLSINVAVLATVQNVEKFLQEAKEQNKTYHYIEVMSCAGGCINGGGQPLLKNKVAEQAEILEKRRSVLYSIDKNKTKRQAHENTMVLEYLDWIKSKNDEHLEHNLLHTKI